MIGLHSAKPGDILYTNTEQLVKVLTVTHNLIFTDSHIFKKSNGKAMSVLPVDTYIVGRKKFVK